MTATIISFPSGPAREARALTAGTADGECLWDQDSDDWSEEASAVLDQVEALLESGQTHDVVALCERGVVCVLDAAPEIEDTAAVTTLVERLLDLHLRACRVARVDPVALAGFVYGIATTNALVIARVVDPYLSLLGDAGRAEMRRLLTSDQVRARSSSGILRSIIEVRLRPVEAALARGDHPSAV